MSSALDLFVLFVSFVVKQFCASASALCFTLFLCPLETTKNLKTILAQRRRDAKEDPDKSTNLLRKRHSQGICAVGVKLYPSAPQRLE
jgi:hypothetical protein